MGEIYNQRKLELIRKGVCTGCKIRPCQMSPEMVNICMFETFEYRLRSGRYNLGGNGNSVQKASDDVKGVIINTPIGNIPVSVDDIKRLFVARYDTYCLQNKQDPKEFPDTKQTLTDDIIFRSLLGEITIGVRPVNLESNFCKWICYDVDKDSCKGTIYESNPKDAVKEIIKNLKGWYGLTSYLEPSGSKDSYHVWIFIEPIDNKKVLKFDEDFKNKSESSINQAICKRVEEKSGHMIKLPFNINGKNGKRSFLICKDLSKIVPQKLVI